MDNGSERKPSATPNGQERGTSESVVGDSPLSASLFFPHSLLDIKPKLGSPIAAPIAPGAELQSQTLPPLFEALPSQWWGLYDDD
ncbi:uncharacterized protein PG986_009019 [Apiospora aurea]|uniref:Uncharacterized protein n=1 Tax=Apiospora aurea TaxID=335848 RepID=A0ABR1Q6Q1_9PEZI